MTGKLSAAQLQAALPDDVDDGPTQLADRFPRTDTPLRVEPPAALKAPKRRDAISRDAHLRRSAFSPRAATARRELLAKLGAGPDADAARFLDPRTKEGKQLQALDREVPDQTALGPFNTSVANYRHIAFSSKRAGHRDAEAQTYFCIGVMHDNVDQLDDALRAYAQFLQVAKDVDDEASQALAYNSMGVDQMLGACPAKASGDGFGASTLDAHAVSKLEKAIRLHERHAQVADDGGRFAAFTNLGLCRGALGDADGAARHHQDALRLAITLESSSGQAIAVGNLGSLATRRGDFATARPCVEQHLALVQSLGDAGAETHAHMQLGHLASAEGDHAAALTSFAAAAAVAEQTGEVGTLKRANCYVGVARGALTVGAMFRGLSDRVRADEARLVLEAAVDAPAPAPAPAPADAPQPKGEE